MNPTDINKLLRRTLTPNLETPTMSNNQPIKCKFIRRIGSPPNVIALGACDIGQARCYDGSVILITWGRNLRYEDALRYMEKGFQCARVNDVRQGGNVYANYEIVLPEDTPMVATCDDVRGWVDVDNWNSVPPNVSMIKVYWDIQQPDNEGWAYIVQSDDAVVASGEINYLPDDADAYSMASAVAEVASSCGIDIEPDSVTVVGDEWPRGIATWTR